jgi:hypothetical protein
MLSRLLLSRLSLTRRLTFFFTLVAASIVLGIGRIVHDRSGSSFYRSGS